MRSSRRRGPSAIATVRSGVALAPGGARIDERDRNAAPHRLLDRRRERQAGRARAGDDDVEDRSEFRHEAFSLRPRIVGRLQETRNRSG